MNLPLGKVPPHLLGDTVFKYLGSRRDDIILGPSKGEDAAIVKAGNELLALHCDPVSAAYNRVGLIAMNVATNDIATRGIRPRWAISCILLPEGSDRTVLETISKDMDSAAQQLGVAIVGGHSEVTPGLNHPIVIVFPVGVAEGGKYVTSGNAKPGGKIILTKSVGLEGTAVLAYDKAEVLTRRFGREFVARCQSLFEKLSVMKEALLAFETNGVLAMHDPTEGGLAGGLNELADAANVGFRIYEDKIRIMPETRKICSFFEIDPLQLISSGSLLIVAKPENSQDILDRLDREGIRCNVIGEITQDKNRSMIKKDGQEVTLPMPLFDDLWKAIKVTE
jgi:hydrogenase expression/formation protein HypE